MAHQNNQHHLRHDDSMDLHKFLESFIEASCEKKKMLEFDLKYSVPYTQRLIQKHLGISVFQDLELSSSAASSSFQLLQQTNNHLASRPAAGSEKNMPQVWKDLIRMNIISDPQVLEEPAKTSFGSNLKELQSLGEHEERAEDLNPAINNSNSSPNFPTTRPLTDDSSNSPNPSINPTRPDAPPMASDSHIIIDNMPTTHSPPPPPHDDNSNKLGFAVFAVELVAALTNLAVSSEAKHDQVLIYVVVACSALAFSISSTALILQKKRAEIAKKMQMAAFVIGTFGFMGIVGMLLPPTISWCFTISASFLCLLMFAVASLIE